MKHLMNAMADPIHFWDAGYIISANLYPTLQEAVQVFSDDFGYQVDSAAIHKTWCKWHAGINDDGETQNMWWQHDGYEGQRGAQPAWMTSPDHHKRRHGHSYERSKPNLLAHGGPCKVCGENA